MKKVITHEVELIPIMTPNFISTKDGQAISIAEFTNAELRVLGAEFTNNLIEKAEKKRKLG